MGAHVTFVSSQKEQKMRTFWSHMKISNSKTGLNLCKKGTDKVGCLPTKYLKKKTCFWVEFLVTIIAVVHKTLSDPIRN